MTEQQMFDQGIKYWEQGKFKKAIRNQRKLLEINPRHGEALYHLGHLYKTTKQYELASACFDKSAQINHRPYISNLMASVSLDFDKQHERAIVYCLKCAAISPTNPEPWLHLSNIYAKMENREKSFESLEKAMEIDPSYAHAFTSYGHKLFKWGEPEKAIPYLQKGLALGDTLYAPMNFGFMCLMRGDEKGAIENYLLSIRSNGAEKFMEKLGDGKWFTDRYKISRSKVRKVKVKALKQYEAENVKIEVTFKTFSANINPYRRLKRWLKYRKL